MKIEKIDSRDVPNVNIYFKRSENRKILEEFADMNCNLVEVKDFTTKNAMYCAASLNSSIKRYKMFNLRAVSRMGRVFLLKEIG